MTTALPVREEDRLAALGRIDLLHGPDEPEFGELVELASAICQVPIGILTVIDEKYQYYLARHGINSPGVPRDESFCQYTILQDELLIVEDTKIDDTFREHPAVTSEPAIRFYAGVSILSPDKQPVGTLCVADFVPRRLSELQIRALKVLAKHANARFELRQRRLELERCKLELELANAQLAALAATDALTGLPNRRAFDERLTAEFTQARRKGRPLSVMLIDIDNFKRLNDKFGHEEGDRCLQEMARLLEGTLRKSDLVARYGGEEFGLLFPDTDASQAEHLGRRLAEAVRSHPWRLMPKTVSGGVASLTSETADQQELVRRADAALYAAKHDGKDKILLA